jgi:hypothetical protein
VTFEKRSSYSSLTTSSDKLNPDGTAPHFFRLQRIDFAGVDFASLSPLYHRLAWCWRVQVEVDDADGALCAGGDLSHPPHLQAERAG